MISLLFVAEKISKINKLNYSTNGDLRNYKSGTTYAASHSCGFELWLKISLIAHLKI